MRAVMKIRLIMNNNNYNKIYWKREMVMIFKIMRGWVMNNLVG
jgi:hypothetical protein